MDPLELAQWIMIAFLMVFVLGLTRQLGSFIRPHREQLSEMGPSIGDELPDGLLDAAERSRLATVIRTKSRASRGALFVVDESCGGCQAVLEDLLEAGRPGDVGLAAIVKDRATPAFRATVASAVDYVVDDRTGSRCEAADIFGTPLVLLLDERCRVVAKDFGGDLVATIRDSAPAAADAFGPMAAQAR